MAVNDSISGVIPITPGTPTRVGRFFFVICATAGDVEVRFADDSVVTVPVRVGFNAFPFQVENVTAGSPTTADASYFNGL